MNGKDTESTEMEPVDIAEIEDEIQIDDAGQPYSDMGLQNDDKDEWLISYEVNEKGIGRILLPPTLSILLQSDRVSIVPSAGGLFIRSVNNY
ncbi:MAG TPA: hypothetical protein VN455_00230 [Methanotrichaceae archaeon]|nr:hypothetical protein [Methanotrichaceae archaeon]